MAKRRSASRDYLEYLGLRLGAMLLHSFAIDDCLDGARGVGAMMFALDKRHRRRAIANIRRSIPHVDEPTARGIAERSMQHFLQLGVEVMFTPRLITIDSWADRVTLVNLEEALDVMLADRPTILVTGHYGNWELLGYTLATVGLDMDAIARPIDNPLLNDWLLGVRQRQGMRILTKWGASDRMAKILADHGTLGFIGDQNAGDGGMFVPFFGRLASAYKSIGLLAMAYDAPIICGYARRAPKPGQHFHYEIGAADIIYPSDWVDREDPLYYLTARYNRAMETMVRDCPDQYLWLHRRWKSRPRHERRGKPMPDNLRRKLESLPWMTPSLLAQLAEPIPDNLSAPNAIADPCS